MKFGYDNHRGSTNRSSSSSKGKESSGSSSSSKSKETNRSVITQHNPDNLSFVYDVNNLRIELDLEKILSFRDAKNLSDDEIEVSLIQISGWAASVIYLLSYFSDLKSRLQVNYDIWWSGMISKAEKSIMLERASGLDILSKLPDSASALETQVAKEKIRMFRDSFGSLSRARVGEYLIQTYSVDYSSKKLELQDIENKLSTLERVFKELGEKSNNLRAVYKRRVEERRLTNKI